MNKFLLEKLSFVFKQYKKSLFQFVPESIIFWTGLMKTNTYLRLLVQRGIELHIKD
jgi:hypothetical protein